MAPKNVSILRFYSLKYFKECFLKDVADNVDRLLPQTDFLGEGDNQTINERCLAILNKLNLNSNSAQKAIQNTANPKALTETIAIATLYTQQFPKANGISRDCLHQAIISLFNCFLISESSISEDISNILKEPRNSTQLQCLFNTIITLAHKQLLDQTMLNIVLDNCGLLFHLKEKHIITAQSAAAPFASISETFNDIIRHDPRVCLSNTKAFLDNFYGNSDLSSNLGLNQPYGEQDSFIKNCLTFIDFIDASSLYARRLIWHFSSQLKAEESPGQLDDEYFKQRHLARQTCEKITDTIAIVTLYSKQNPKFDSTRRDLLHNAAVTLLDHDLIKEDTILDDLDRLTNHTDNDRELLNLIKIINVFDKHKVLNQDSYNMLLDNTAYIPQLVNDHMTYLKSSFRSGHFKTALEYIEASIRQPDIYAETRNFTLTKTRSSFYKNPHLATYGNHACHLSKQYLQIAQSQTTQADQASSYFTKEAAHTNLHEYYFVDNYCSEDTPTSNPSPHADKDNDEVSSAQRISTIRREDYPMLFGDSDNSDDDSSENELAQSPPP